MPKSRSVLPRGRRVYLARPEAAAFEEFATMARDSRRLHRPWTAPPADADAFASYVARSAGDDFEALWVRQCGDDALVGVYNLSQIFYGALQSAYLGYYASQALAGRGLMGEGLDLVLAHAFRGLGLHRVEANIQPGNTRSVRLVERAGFVREGFSRRYLKIAGRWRDHCRYALLREDWQARRRRG